MAPTPTDPRTRIAARLGGAPGASRPLAGGVSATVELLEVLGGDPERVVLRSGGAAWKDLDLAREHDLLQVLAERGLPVPRPIALDPGAERGPILVLPYVENEPGTDPAAMGALLGRLHEVQLDGLPALPLRDDPVPELRTYLPPHLDPLRPLLREVGPPRRRRLLHGDFWPGNVLWRGGHVAALIDWEDAAVGDPHADVAQCRLELFLRDEAAPDVFLDAYPHPLEPLRMALWELLASAGCLAHLGEWGLASEVEATMRSRATRVLARAAEDLRLLAREDSC